jgi:uncharacterized protein YdeI (YjbR/CyaY-like superfamily)
MTGKGEETPRRLFKTQAAWTAWLEKNHTAHSGLWLQMAKKGSGVQSVSYPEALESALCYGWIDGQKRPEDDKTWLQRFVPRSSRSIWSKINREKAEALINRGRMNAAGLKAIEHAKANGRWQAAYDSQSRSAVPQDFEIALKHSPKAKRFFEKIDSANRYALLFRIHAAKKPQTRARKIREFISMLERRETIHPQRLRRLQKSKSGEQR